MSAPSNARLDASAPPPYLIAEALASQADERQHVIRDIENIAKEVAGHFRVGKLELEGIDSLRIDNEHRASSWIVYQERYIELVLTCEGILLAVAASSEKYLEVLKNIPAGKASSLEEDPSISMELKTIKQCKEDSSELSAAFSSLVSDIRGFQDSLAITEDHYESAREALRELRQNQIEPAVAKLEGLRQFGSLTGADCSAIETSMTDSMRSTKPINHSFFKSLATMYRELAEGLYNARR